MAGVDSSVAAIILQNQGYEVIGATMKLWEFTERDIAKCGTKDAINDAKEVCEKLGIKHYVFDLKQEFDKCVIKNFIETYEKANTPNPCIECNKHIKFKSFYEKALELECDYIATGHYAKIEYSNKYNQYILKKAENLKKDQSYVLYGIPKEMLSKILFPLGKFKDKSEIRDIAIKNDLHVANTKDSQDICFIPDNNYVRFLKENSNIKYAQGNIVNKFGEILGKHNGLINYTIGQRKGLGISNENPLYVINLDKEKNEVIVGEEKELYSKEVNIINANFLVNLDIKNSINVKAKVRYSTNEEDAILYEEDKIIKIEFINKQRAITKGQSAVFYIGDILIGGGIIA